MKRFLLCAGILAVAGSSVAMGASLEMIPPLAGQTSNQPNAITPDGQYVVGNSGTNGFLYPVGSGAPVLVISSDNAAAAVANGVGYRTSGGQQELIISGMSSGYVTEWMTNDGGASFGIKRRNISYDANTVSGSNQLGSPGNTDEYFVTSRISSQLRLDINRGTGPWVATIDTSPKSVTDQARMQGIGATGAAVGSRVNSGIRQNYRMDYKTGASPGNFYFAGLSTTNALQGEAYDVSDDGLAAAGWSPVGASTTNSNAYKAQFAFNGTSYSWVRTDMLPETGLEGASTTRTVAYSISPDGRWLAGGSYQSDGWHAMLWDTADADPANWTYTDLWQLATSQGIMDGFVNLQRVWSVGLQPGTGLPVVTGTGSWSDGVNTYSRGFVMVVPEPTTLGLLLLGLPLLRRRR